MRLDKVSYNAITIEGDPGTPEAPRCRVSEIGLHLQPAELPGDVLMTVNDFIGIPFCSRGRSRESGMDCWGLVVAAERELFGKELPSLDCRYTSAYDRKNRAGSYQ